jgi:2-oxoglutarate ferredoxin oxidoreductase subunit beta
LINTIQKAHRHRGFSFIDVLSICPVQFGRRNQMKSPGEMIKELRKNSLTLEKAKTLPKESLRGKFITGEFCADLDRTWGGYAQG